VGAPLHARQVRCLISICGTGQRTTSPKPTSASCSPSSAMWTTTTRSSFAPKLNPPKKSASSVKRPSGLNVKLERLKHRRNGSGGCLVVAVDAVGSAQVRRHPHDLPSLGPRPDGFAPLSPRTDGGHSKPTTMSLQWIFHGPEGERQMTGGMMMTSLNRNRRGPRSRVVLTATMSPDAVDIALGHLLPVPYPPRADSEKLRPLPLYPTPIILLSPRLLARKGLI